MNEHIRRGNEALARSDLKTAKVEYSLALDAPNATIQRIAKNRLSDLERDLPLQIGAWKECIIPAAKSQCCGARAIFVLSRPGNFISKNCTRCGVPDHARERDFRPINHCGKEWPVVIIDQNYHYYCDSCGTTWLVATNVPRYSDLFPYCGLAAPGDPSWQR
jgi:hypothetical protein